MCIKSEAQCQAGPDVGHCPMSGGGLICVIICMVGSSMGSSLSFVLTVFSFGFRYFQLQREVLKMTALHTP